MGTLTKEETIKGMTFWLIVIGVIAFMLWFSNNSGPVERGAEQTDTEYVSAVAERWLTGDVLDVRVIDGTERINVTYELISTDAGYAERQVARLVCDLRDGFAGWSIVAAGRLPVVDAFGNESLISGLLIRLEGETVAAINCDNAMLVNLASIADMYSVDRLME